MNTDLKSLAEAALDPSGPLGENSPHAPLTSFLLAHHAVINKANDSVSLTEILDGYNLPSLPARLSFFAFARFRAPETTEVAVGFMMLDPSGEPIFYQPGSRSALQDPTRGFNVTMAASVVINAPGLHTGVLLYNERPIAVETLPIKLLEMAAPSSGSER